MNAPSDEDKVMIMWMAQVVACAIRGTMACFPHVRIEKVLLLFAAVMGQQIASSCSFDDEFAAFRFRKACTDAFSSGTKKEKVALRTQDKAEASIGQ